MQLSDLLDIEPIKAANPLRRNRLKQPIKATNPLRLTRFQVCYFRSDEELVKSSDEELVELLESRTNWESFGFETKIWENLSGETRKDISIICVMAMVGLSRNDFPGSIPEGGLVR